MILELSCADPNFPLLNFVREELKEIILNVMKMLSVNVHIQIGRARRETLAHEKGF